ncbi:MAG: hypothetical protein JWQ30_1622 [Sediminibacterium sp.]|nr:hypothetical protein [Sediminibacterium sp.]
MKKLLMAVYLLIAASSFAQQGTLLVANKDDNTLSFVDLKQLKVIATIPVGVGPHEVSVSPSGKFAAVANYGNRAGASHSVSVIDVAKKESVKEIDMGEYIRPHGMEFISEDELIVTSEAKKALLRVNIQTGSVSLVAMTDQLTSHMVAYSHNDQKAYVANINSGTVSVIDVKQNKLLQNIALKPGIEGLAVSPDGKELWVANQKEDITSVINTSTLTTVMEFPAKKLAYRVRFLANGKYAAVSNGTAGSVSIYDVAAKKWVKDIDVVSAALAVDPDPGGIAVSLDNKWMFVCTTGLNQVVVINTSDWSIATRINTGKGPDGIYYSKVEMK